MKISKKTILDVQHTLFCTFLCRCFPRLQRQRETSRNVLVTRFLEEMSYVFSFTFFHCPHFHLALAASISHFVTAATKFSCFSSNKRNASFVFCFFACRLLSLFLCLSLALYSKFLDVTINLNLIL